MTKQHRLGHYQDGRVSVAYCKDCSAEGDKLLEGCPQKIDLPSFRRCSLSCDTKLVDKKEILEKFEKPLDEKKQTVK